MIEHYRRVLFLGAHPDDEMACSGTIARLREDGATVEVLTFSNCGDLIPEGFTVEDLIAEWTAAFGLLGVERDAMVMGDIPNRHFPAHRQTILDELIRRRDAGPPDLVLIPATSDIHQDHATVAQEAVRAFKHCTILGYEHAMNSIHGSRWTGFVKLEPEHLDRKLAHAAAYHSQAHRIYMAESYLRGLTAVRGVQVNAMAAEAFEVIRLIT